MLRINFQTSECKNLCLNSSPTSNSKSSQSLTVVTILYLAVWFALATGFGDVLILGLRKFFFQQAANRGLDVIWMAPLAYVPFFVISALTLSLFSVDGLQLSALSPFISSRSLSWRFSACFSLFRKYTLSRLCCSARVWLFRPHDRLFDVLMAFVQASSGHWVQ